MTQDRSSRPDPPGDPDLTGAESKLLSLALPGPRRPVDELIERLARDDGPAWLRAAARAAAQPIAGLLRDGLCADPPGLEALVAAKNACTRDVQRPPDPDARLIGMAGYFIAVAAALVHHGTCISSRPRDEIDAILIDLAAVMPRPWSRLLQDGAVAEG